MKKGTFEKVYNQNKGEMLVILDLYACSESGKQKTPSDLSEALSITTARVSAILGSLEKKGLIERNIDKDNRRNIIVTLTETGVTKAKVHKQTEWEKFANVFKNMGEKDTTDFIKLMEKFTFEMHKELKGSCWNKEEETNK